MNFVLLQWTQAAELSFVTNTTWEIPGMPLWPIVAVVAAGLLIFVWWWRRRRAAFAERKSLYGSWHAAIPRYRRSLHRLAAELERARRYHRALTVTVLAVNFDQHKQKKRNLISLAGNAEIASQFFFSLVSSLLRDNVRGNDLVTYDVTNDYYVLLFPESTATAAEQTLLRLQQLVMQRSKVMLRYGIAEYPKDGLIIQDLVSRALAKSLRMAGEMPPPAEPSTNGQKEPGTEPLAQVRI